MSVQVVQIPYKPFPSQALFHQGEERIKLFSGGWGSGKTYAGSIEALKLAILNDGCDGFVCAPTWSMLTRVTLRAFLEVLPPQIIRRHVKGERFIELVHGGRIYYGSTDRSETLEGTNLAWFWLDEARFSSWDAYQILLGRLRSPYAKRLQGLLTSTPSMNYLFDEFGQRKRNRGLYVGKTSENTALDPSFLENLQATLSPQAFKLYAEGAFINVSGGVFDNFSTNDNCCHLDYDPNYPMDIAIDFGYNKPAVLFCQTLGRCQLHHCDDCVHVIAELMPDRCPTSKLVLMIDAAMKRFGWHGNVCYIDPAGRSKSVQTGITDVGILEAHGFICAWTMSTADRIISNGIELIRSKICNVRGERSIFFNDTLIDSKRGIVRALMQSKYPDKDNAPSPDEPIKDGLVDHARDALRYYLVNKFPVRDYMQGIL